MAVSTLLLYAVFLALSPLLLAYVVGRRVWVRTLRYHRPQEDLRIAIVGAGWSGLQCLQRFRQLGVDQVDVFERYDDIGGTWNPNLRYHVLQIHGSMTVTSFEGFPYSDDPDVQGGKVMAEEVERYIHRFADAHELRSSCRFSTNVDAISYRSQDRTATLTLTDRRTGRVETSGPCDLVVWASMAAYGNVPKLPGAQAFQGKQLHTVEYSDAEFDDIVRHGRHGDRRRQGGVRRGPGAQARLAPESRGRVEELAQDLRPLIEARSGCSSVTFFGDDAAGEWGMFVLWESQEAADAAAAVMRPKLDADLRGHLQAPPDTRLFEVLPS